MGAFRRWFTDRLPPAVAYRLAEGPLEVGGVGLEIESGRAVNAWRPDPLGS